MKIFFLIPLLLIFNSAWGAYTVAPLESDYCTNYNEGTRTQPDLWKHCCLIHDMYFWAGGSKHNRYDSDAELKSCIEETGYSYVAHLMYLAVRAGSYSPIKYSNKKWNHGWKGRPTFQSLSVEDIEVIEKELFSENYDFISPEIKNHFVDKLRSRLE